MENQAAKRTRHDNHARVSFVLNTNSNRPGKVSACPAVPYLKITRQLGCMTRPEYQAFVCQQTISDAWLDSRCRKAVRP